MSPLRLGTLILFFIGITMSVLYSLGALPLDANNPLIFIGCALAVVAIMLVVSALTPRHALTS